MFRAGQSNLTQSLTTSSTISSAISSVLSSSQTSSLTLSSPQIAPTTDSPSSSISAVAQPGANLTKSHNNAVAIGAVIGVPLGLLLVTGLAWLLQREKRSRRPLEQKIQDMQASIQIHESLGHNGNADRQAGNFQPSELHNLDRPSELHSQPTVELGQHL